MKKPIMKFENKEEAEKSLKEWQDKLFLQNWIIKINLVNNIDDEDACMGKIDYLREYLTAEIRIKKELNTGTISKVCHEQILVHELLHLVIAQNEQYESIENLYWNTNQHQIIEQMAKSLIMAKYDLDYDWFRNF